MIDVSGIEYDFLPSVLWVLIPTLLCFTVVAVILKSGTLYDEVWIGGVFAFALAGGIVTLVMGGLLGVGAASRQAVAQEESAIASEQLADQGFDRLDLNWSGKTFTASVEG